MLFTQYLTSVVAFATAALAAPLKRATVAGVNYTLPSVASQLPQPDPALTLKYITIGHGVQNYTCESATATPTATGALAVLYDITPLFPDTPGTGLTASEFQGLSSEVLRKTEVPLNLPKSPAGNDSDGSITSSKSKPAEAPPSPFLPPADLALPGAGSAPFLGHHYFDIQSSPTFDLFAGTDPAGLVLAGAKTGDVKAPPDADRGPLDTGAVDWLQLSDNGRGISAGVTLVYRIVTAGGVAPPCSQGSQATSVPYVAQYWVYGP